MSSTHFYVNLHGSLKPKPPSSFVTHLHSHAIYRIFFPIPPFSQQKPIIFFFELHHKPQLALKFIKKFGIDCIAIFNKLALPPFDKDFFVHPRNFCSIWPVKDLKTTFLFLPIFIGTPRYFPGTVTSHTLRILQIQFLFSFVVLGLKTILDLLKLLARRNKCSLYLLLQDP